MAEINVVRSVGITDAQSDWINENDINFSRFVRRVLDEKMNVAETEDDS